MSPEAPLDCDNVRLSTIVQHRQLLATCAVDSSGVIVAGDDRLPSWLTSAVGNDAIVGARFDSIVDDAKLLSRVKRLVEGDGDGDDPDGPTLCEATVAQTRVVIYCRRLLSRDGPLALIDFYTDAAPTPSRLDPLTQLADRDAIAQRVAAWQREAAPQPPRFALLFLDLDNFKLINDRYGHAAGDAVLQALASRWMHCVRDSDLVARYGGDEFVVLVKDAGSQLEAAPIIRRIGHATRQPIDVAGQTLQLSVSIGTAWSDAVPRSLDEIVHAADRDMYSNKGAAAP
jgi:diguanylate cyclase (GGDEF)-like protein